MQKLFTLLAIASCHSTGVSAVESEKDASYEVDSGYALTCADVAIIVDMSSSMDIFLPEVRDRILLFDKRARFALVGAPDAHPDHTNVSLISDFTSLMILRNTLYSPEFGPTGYISEPTLDSISDVMDPNNPLKLSWKSSERIVVIFTDEVPQSFRAPHILPEWIRNTAQLYVFTAPERVEGWEKTLASLTPSVNTFDRPFELELCK